MSKLLVVMALPLTSSMRDSVAVDLQMRSQYACLLAWTQALWWLICRYNYTVYQDTEHGRQKLIRDSVETTVSVLDKVRHSMC